LRFSILPTLVVISLAALPPDVRKGCAFPDASIKIHGPTPRFLADEQEAQPRSADRETRKGKALPHIRRQSHKQRNQTNSLRLSAPNARPAFADYFSRTRRVMPANDPRGPGFQFFVDREEVLDLS